MKNQFLRKYVNYEAPSNEETEAITSYVRLIARKKVQGRSEEDIEDLIARFMAQGLGAWRGKHRTLDELDNAALWKKFTWGLFEFICEARDTWKQEKSSDLCDAGMVSKGRSMMEERLPRDPENDDTSDLKTPTAGVEALQDRIPRGELERRSGRRAQFLNLLDRHSPATEYVEREGSPVARFLLRILRDVQRGHETAEEALEVLSVVLETNELRFKERQKRVAWFLAMLEDYENFDYQSYAENGPVTQYPECGLSEAPMLVPALSAEQVERLKSRYGLHQGQLAELFNFDPTDVPGMKKRRSSAIEQAEEVLTLETEAKAVLETRRAEILEKLEAVLMGELET